VKIEDMTIHPHFPDQLITSAGPLKSGSRIFILESHFRYYSSIGPIVVPPGFHTDGASIPRIFWPIMGPHGDYFESAVIHDFLYSRQSPFHLTRKQADDIFKEAMFNSGVKWPTRETVYRAVRLAGARSWKKR
jgi:hypothetical protein